MRPGMKEAKTGRETGIETGCDGVRRDETGIETGCDGGGGGSGGEHVALVAVGGSFRVSRLAALAGMRQGVRQG